MKILGEEIMNELIKMDARQVVELLKRYEVSPIELIDILVKRINGVEEKVNAVPTLCVDRAKENAKLILENRPDNPPPYYLYGLPILVKDLTEAQGVRTTFG